MNRLFVSIFVIIFWLNSAAWANGGPYNISEFVGTGNINFIQAPDIVLESENIEVVINKDDEASVNVTYVFFNKGAAQKYDYAFPVEYSSTKLLESDKTNINLKEFTIKDAGKELLFQTREEDVNGHTFESIGKEQKGFLNIETSQDNIKRRWYMTSLLFESGEHKKVTVSYKVPVLFNDWVTSKDFLPEVSERLFSYILGPSQYWADGILKSFNVRIDVSQILKVNGLVIKILPSGYTENKDGMITWGRENYDLKTAKNIEVVYSNNDYQNLKYINEHKINSADILDCKTSSTLKASSTATYDCKNLFDNNLTTAWCEGVGGNGVNEFIEVTLNKAEVGLVGLVNGYAKNKEVYTGNNRVKSIETSLVLENAHKPEPVIIGLEDRQIYLTDISQLKQLQWIYNNGDPFEKTSKIRLTIKEIFSGTKYNDTCISEIIFAGYK